MGRFSATPRYHTPHLGAVLACQGRTQRWLAGRLGVSEAFVSLLAAGARTVDRDTGERLAALLGIPLFLLCALAVPSDRIPPGDGHG